MQLMLHEFSPHNLSADRHTARTIAFDPGRCLFQRFVSSCYWLTLVCLGGACTPQPQVQNPIIPDCPQAQPVCQIVFSSNVKAEPLLQQLQVTLARQQWRVADRLTTRLFDTIAAQNQVDRGNSELSCSDLKTLDRLWTTASQAQFGLQSQKQVWESLNPATQAAMHQAVGWSKQGTNPFLKGHFPYFSQRYFSEGLIWFSRHEVIGESDYPLPGPDPTSTSDWCCHRPRFYRLELCGF